MPAIISTNVVDLVKEGPALTGALNESLALLCQTQGQEMEDINLYTCGQVTLPPRKVTVITARTVAKRGYEYGLPSIIETLPVG